MNNWLGFVLLPLFFAVWRRCYGGWDTPIWKKLFPRAGSALHRNFWRCVNIAVVFSFCHFAYGFGLLPSLFDAAVLMFVMWDWSFGMYMGIGRRAVPLTDDDIDEYEEQLFAPFLGWLFDTGDRYGAFYDFTGLALRFAVPGLPLFGEFGFEFCLMGLIVPLAYLVEIRFAEKGMNEFLCRNFAELASGFSYGLLLAAI